MKGKYRKRKWQVYFWRPDFLWLPEPETLEGFYPVNTDTSKKRHTMPKRCL